MNDTQLRLELVLDMAQLGMWDFDPRAAELEWTPRAKSFFGIGPDETVTFEKICQRIHPADRERAHAALQRAFRGEDDDYRLEFRTVDENGGKVRWIEAVGVVRRDEQGLAARIIGVSRDLTPNRDHESDLAKAKELADVANLAKTQFLANMSHEMRTPLGAILGFADLALDERQPRENRDEFLRTIKRNGELLLNLINEVLDLSKVEASKVQLEKIQFSFADALEEVVSVFRRQAREKRIDLLVTSVGKIPAHIKTDPFRFKQILTNLIGNAVKFTERGRVQVTVRMVPPAIVGKKVSIEVAVSDTGIGIPSNSFDKLFQRFSQADSSVSRRYGGTGLGLALSRQLARALGGDIVLRESALDRGSTFAFTFENGLYSEDLPLMDLNAEDRGRAPRGEPAPKIDLSGVRVLVAEDAPDNQVLASLILKAAGAQVDIAQNGAEAVALAEQREYDVILMDIQMPVLDGYGATEALRREGYTKPIIALTAHAMVSEKDRCLNAGFDNHLSKPITRKMLLEEVAQFATRKATLH